MRKVISLMHVSLDGFVGGPNGEMDWIIHDDEIFQDVTRLLNEIDTALYGRVTYQMMESYWPAVPGNPSSTKLELHHADWVENIHKVVFSKMLDKVEWNNTRLIKENIRDEVIELKHQPGKNMMIFGSPTITHFFMQMDLIDEYALYINPVIIGNGIPLFNTLDYKGKHAINLRLLKTKTFNSGVVGFRYETKHD